MKRIWPILLLLACDGAKAADCVILLHGLLRSDGAMTTIANALSQEGYVVVNEAYPSRRYPIEELATLAVEQGLTHCGRTDRIHFVTHSLGGILVRYYLENHDIDKLGRVVMLAPPNQGSEVVDALRDVPGFELINGPAGLQLGTDDESIPGRLGPVAFELGIIAGTTTIDPISSGLLPNPDDGKVSVDSTKVEGMADFITVPRSHAFMMHANDVIAQVIVFLKTGAFSKQHFGSIRMQESGRAIPIDADL